MKKLFSKKAFPFLLGTAAVVTMPLTAVSCLYEDDVTVKFAKNYDVNNSFVKRTQERSKDADVIAKFKEWEQKPGLIQFFKELDNSNVMTYTFTYWDFLFKNSFDIKNDDVKIVADKLYTISENHKSISVDEKVFSETLKDANNDAKDKARTLVGSVATLLNDYYASKDTNTKHPTEKVEDFEKVAIQKLTAKQLEDAGYSEKQIAIVSKIDSLMKVVFFNEDPAKFISLEDVKEALKIYFKNSPFMDAIIEDETRDSNSRILKQNAADRSYTINFSVVNKTNSGISSSLFQSFFKTIQGSLLNFDYDSTISKERDMVSNIVNLLIQKSQSFTIKRDKDGNIMTQSLMGVGGGFSPLYFIDGLNPDTNEPSDDFKIFKQISIDNINKITSHNITEFNQTALTPEEASEFSGDPLKFFQTHKYLAWFGTEPLTAYGYFTSLQGQYQNARMKLEASTTKAKDRELYQAFLDHCQPIYDQMMMDIARLKEIELQKIALLKANNGVENDETKAIDKEIDAIMTHQYKLPRRATNLEATIDVTLQEGYEQSFKKLLQGKAKVGTNVQSFAELFAKIGFTLGITNIQVIRGNSPELANSYWLEFQNRKTGEWYFLDVFKLYTEFYYTSNEYVTEGEGENATKKLVNSIGSRKDISNLSVEYINSQIQTSLPTGYTVSAEYLPYANIK
ncbi:hypothetical protein ACNF36_01090 [Mycoplasma sp. 4463]|uniref:hypothetical protein n=1 Tax=Mycoplasma sp. 4463 TaxID=3400998 RepID=UPI003AAF6F7D